MKNTKAVASENPKSNRRGPVITDELVAEIKRLAELGKCANEIADAINWPWHCSLKRIREWMK